MKAKFQSEKIILREFCASRMKAKIHSEKDIFQAAKYSAREEYLH